MAFKSRKATKSASRPVKASADRHSDAVARIIADHNAGSPGPLPKAAPKAPKGK